MDLEEILTKIQWLLSNADRTIGPLSNLSKRDSNEKQILNITSQLNKLLIQNKYLSEDQEHLNEEMLRKVTLYLILNSELSDKSNLVNEPNVGHLVENCPTLPFCLLFDCIWGLNLDCYFCEILQYCPITLTTELLKPTLTSIRYSLPYPLLSRVQKIIFALYCKLHQLASEKVYYITFDQAVSELVGKIVEFLQFYINPSSFQMNDWGVTELYRYAGYALQSILQLTDDCLSIYLKKLEIAKNDSHKIYNFEYKIGAEKYLSSKIKNEKIINALQSINNNCLLNTCEANIKAINVKVFCSWAEHEFNSETKQTLQQNIATTAYVVKEKLGDLNLEEDFCEEMTGILSSIASKPLTLDEEMNSANTDEILEKVSKKSGAQKRWFKHFLTLENVVTDKKCFSTLLKNIELCDVDDIKLLFDKVYDHRDKNVPDIKKMKETLLNSLLTLSRDERMKIVDHFFSGKGLNNFYESSDFHKQLTELFNKAVSTDILNNFPELLMQNPKVVLQKVYEECFKNREKLKVLIFVLKYCEPLCHFTVDNDSGKELGTELLEDICKSFSSEDLQNCDLPITIKEFVSEELVSVQELARRIIFPMIEQNVSDYNYQNATRWLEVCKVICEKEDFWPLYKQFLIFLSNTLSFTRVDINSFSLHAIGATEIITQLIALTIAKVKTENLFKKEEIQTLKTMLCEESGRDDYYFEPLWNEDMPNYLNYLLMGKVKDHTQNWNVTKFLQILPFSTLTEWKIIVKNYLEELNDYIELFRILNDFITVFSVWVKQSPTQNTLACFEYCVKNFSIIVNEIICPHITDSYQAEKLIWEALTHTASLFPKDIQDSSCMQLIPVLIPLLDRLKERNDQIYTLIAPDLISLEKTQACRLICKKMLENK